MASHSTAGGSRAGSATSWPGYARPTARGAGARRADGTRTLTGPRRRRRAAAALPMRRSARLRNRPRPAEDAWTSLRCSRASPPSIAARAERRRCTAARRRRWCWAATATPLISGARLRRLDLPPRRSAASARDDLPYLRDIREGRLASHVALVRQSDRAVLGQLDRADRPRLAAARPRPRRCCAAGTSPAAACATCATGWHPTPGRRIRRSRGSRPTARPAVASLLVLRRPHARPASPPTASATRSGTSSGRLVLRRPEDRPPPLSFAAGRSTVRRTAATGPTRSPTGQRPLVGLLRGGPVAERARAHQRRRARQRRWAARRARGARGAPPPLVPVRVRARRRELPAARGAHVLGHHAVSGADAPRRLGAGRRRSPGSRSTTRRCCSATASGGCSAPARSRGVAGRRAVPVPRARRSKARGRRTRATRSCSDVRGARPAGPFIRRR